MRKGIFARCFFLVLAVSSAVFSLSSLFAADGGAPFEWKCEFGGDGRALVSVSIPKGYYLDANQVKIDFKQNGKGLRSVSHAETKKHKDEFGESVVYPSGVSKWVFEYDVAVPCSVRVDYQGCRGQGADGLATCFMPSSVSFSYSPEAKDVVGKKAGGVSSYPGVSAEGEGTSKPVFGVDDAGLASSGGVQGLLDRFEVVRVGGGYMSSSDFLKFLSLPKEGESGSESVGMSLPTSFVGLLFVVFLGGLALNLTPCVLPMIPINLAIIGAGTDAGSRSDGFFKGLTYGLGIALAYGCLGLATVLGGARFGSLNASSTFNFVIAGVFVVLSLGMFDVISIDFSKYGSKLNFDGKKGGFAAVFAMGVVAALLAGACVAPVLIAVLLHSTTLYSEGNVFGLALPFLLGVGMAFPWPFAGAGMAVIPKPGSWMTRVKQVFGVLILVFAAYYGWLGVSLCSSGCAGGSVSSDAPLAVLERGLRESEKSGKPVFIDFWASWCKNCLQMEHSTFKDSKVESALSSFVVVKFQAERPKEAGVAEILDRFDVLGLPGYVVLRPKKSLTKH